MDRRIDESVFAELAYCASFACVLAELFAGVARQRQADGGDEAATALETVAALLKRGVQRARDAVECAADDHRPVPLRPTRGKAK